MEERMESSLLSESMTSLKMMRWDSWNLLLMLLVKDEQIKASINRMLSAWISHLVLTFMGNFTSWGMDSLKGFFLT